MTHNKAARAAPASDAGNGPRIISAVAAERSFDTAIIPIVQAKFIARRFHVELDHARVVAGLYFGEALDA
jgi:hypothetical protein